jgi:hypothetical protein
MKEMQDLLSQDRSPITNVRQPPVLDPKTQQGLTHFSLLTHGFGTPAIIAVLNTMQTYCNEMIKLCDNKSYVGSGQGANGVVGQSQGNGLDTSGSSSGKVKSDKDDRRE